MKKVMTLVLGAIVASGAAFASNGDKSSEAYDFRTSGVNFELSSGYNVFTKGGGGEVPINLTVSKPFSEYFEAGVGTGVDIFTSGGSTLIPVYASAKGFLPLSSTKIVPYAEMRMGAAINTAESMEGSYGPDEEDAPNYFIFSIMPGVRIPVSSKCEVDLGIGYKQYAGSGSSVGAVMFKVGVNLNLFSK